MAAIVLLAPRIGALTWKQFESKLSWGLILTVGASMSLARSMIDTGAASWLGAAFVDRLTSVAVAPAAIVVLLVVAVALVHLAITNLAACMALLIPIAVTIAEAAHLNPLACGLIVTIAVDAVILYPVQTAANLLAYEAGYFPSRRCAAARARHAGADHRRRPPGAALLVAARPAAGADVSAGGATSDGASSVVSGASWSSGPRASCALMSEPEARGPEEHERRAPSCQTLMSAFLMISPNDARSRSMVAPKVAGSWKLA